MSRATVGVQNVTRSSDLPGVLIVVESPRIREVGRAATYISISLLGPRQCRVNGEELLRFWVVIACPQVDEPALTVLVLTCVISGVIGFLFWSLSLLL